MFNHISQAISKLTSQGEPTQPSENIETDLRNQGELDSECSNSNSDRYVPRADSNYDINVQQSQSDKSKTPSNKRLRNEISSTETSPEIELKKQKSQQYSPKGTNLQHEMADSTEQLIKKAVQATEDSMRLLIKTELQPVHDLLDTVKQLSADVNQTKSEILRMHKNDKRKNVIVYGLPETKNESYAERQKVIENFATTLRIPTLDYDDAFRLGKVTADKARPLLIKFLRQRDKQLVLQACKNLKGTNISVRDDMTIEERKANAALLKKRAEILKSHPHANIKVRNGLLYHHEGQNRTTKYVFDVQGNDVVKLTASSSMSF